MNPIITKWCGIFKIVYVCSSMNLEEPSTLVPPGEHQKLTRGYMLWGPTIRVIALIKKSWVMVLPVTPYACRIRSPKELLPQYKQEMGLVEGYKTVPSPEFLKIMMRRTLDEKGSKCAIVPRYLQGTNVASELSKNKITPIKE